MCARVRCYNIAHRKKLIGGDRCKLDLQSANFGGRWLFPSLDNNPLPDRYNCGFGELPSDAFIMRYKDDGKMQWFRNFNAKLRNLKKKSIVLLYLHKYSNITTSTHFRGSQLITLLTNKSLWPKLSNRVICKCAKLEKLHDFNGNLTCFRIYLTKISKFSGST